MFSDEDDLAMFDSCINDDSNNSDIIMQEIEDKMKKQLMKESAAEFSFNVEELVWKEDITYMEAILQLAEESGYETDKITKLLTADIKARLQEESEKVGLVKKTNNRLTDFID